jgi:hypothetical protein
MAESVEAPGKSPLGMLASDFRSKDQRVINSSAKGGASPETSTHKSHVHDGEASIREDPREPPEAAGEDEANLREFYNIPSSMDMEEASYLIRTILSFKYYQRKAFALNHERMRSFYAMPEAHRKLVQPEFTQKLEAIDKGIEKNTKIATSIARLGEMMYLDGATIPMDGPIVPVEKFVPFLYSN